jgi:Asp-tRNA(Asn)/Glu-tRNA(Gln) amidotransferase C subunit
MLREDKVEKSLSQEVALANTKLKKDGYFKGPRAV